MQEPDQSDRIKVLFGFHRADLERSLAQDSIALPEPDQGLLPDHSLRLGKPDETVPAPPEHVDHRRKGEWLNKQPLKEWSVDLAPTDDFKERVEKIDAPKDLEPGSYFLFASHDPKFGEQENRVSYSSFWVSDLSLVMRTRHGSGALEGFVLNAITGEPVQGTTVRSWKANATTDKSSSRPPAPMPTDFSVSRPGVPA